MHHPQYRLLVIIILMGSCWYYTFQNISPFLDDQQINSPALFIFLFCMGGTLSALFTLIGYQLRYWFNRRGNTTKFLYHSLRQAIFISGGVVFISLLSIAEIFNIYTLALSIITIITLEWFFR